MPLEVPRPAAAADQLPCGASWEDRLAPVPPGGIATPAPRAADDFEDEDELDEDAGGATEDAEELDEFDDFDEEDFDDEFDDDFEEEFEDDYEIEIEGDFTEAPGSIPDLDDDEGAIEGPV